MYHREAVSGHLAFWLPKPHLPPDLEYLSLMNQTTSTMTSFIPTPFALEFDFSTEGYDNVWEVMGATLAESIQPSDAIVSATYKGEAANGWPTLSIVFASIEVAKAFTYVYLGFDARTADVDSDEEVGEYVSFGKFVN